jgi:hypothetical protein
VQEQHVAAPDELIGAALIQDHARVLLRRNAEGEPRRDVGFDETRHHVHRRPLRRHDEMYPNRPRHLRDATDGRFDIARRDHHEV